MTDSPAAPNPASLDGVLSRDYGRLSRRVRELRQAKVAADDPKWTAVLQSIAASNAKREARAAMRPVITLDESLPVAAEADRIVELIRNHQVIVVAGETGSGKTTQLPKLCLAAGRGAAGMIGCTQPRRIAARSVARRVASELQTPLGGLVGYQVRFTEQVGENTLIKFMTDGILLAETQGDAFLSAYDTIIVDEAHERSLNIDFLLGYLKRLLEKRRDLRVIVTSATIDTERFSRHFGGAPIVSVEGRTFPVDVRYRPLVEPGIRVGEASNGVRRAPVERTVSEGIVAAIDEVTADDPMGDVLVFLPGEREIRDAHLALTRRKYRETEVLPLYARLSARDQDRVFEPGRQRRIVLATNVAETSLTVPRIRYVVDPGLARVNRFSHRHKVQRLHIEPISQASADQRKGRCGRIGPGTCVRLYAEEDFASRPLYTEPELLRSSLAGVILRLLSLKLGAIETFPFLDRPGERAVADGYQQLIELGAILPDRRTLTDIGRQLARLPIDVQLGRMLVEAATNGSLREMLVLAAFLSIQDPRERPADAKEAADNAHAHFADGKSDFVTILKLWDAYRVAHEDMTQSKLRDWCSTHFLSFLRMREWRELHRQLLLLTQELGWTVSSKAGEHSADAADYATVHRSLLSGFPGHVGHKDQKGWYDGTRGRKFLVFPGSGLAKSPPAWVMSAIYLDTARLYGLMNARVEPEWIEQQAQHLVKRRYFDPQWHRKEGRVVGYEQVTLFGLPLVERRKVAYAKIDPVASHHVFVREAVLTGDIDLRMDYVRQLQRVLGDARLEEAKRRRQGLVKSEDELAEWLDERIPPDVLDAVSLDAWFKSLDAKSRAAAVWKLEDVMVAEAAGPQAFPARLRVLGRDLRLTYRFEPGHVLDGVSIHVPLELLNALPEAPLTWLVPGLLADKVAELIRSLPKALRRNFVPAPDFARAFVEADTKNRSLVLKDALGDYLHHVTGVPVPLDAWDERELPPHLVMNVHLLDENGRALADSRDLAALRAEYGDRARAAFAQKAQATLAREHVTRWDFDEIPRAVKTDTGLAAYPALVDREDSAEIRVYESESDAAAMHGGGVLRLLALTLADKLKPMRKQLALSPKVAIAYTAIDSPDRLREDIVTAAFEELAWPRVGDIRTKAAFDALATELSKTVFAAAMKRLAVVEEILQLYVELVPKLKSPLMGFAKANFDDLKAQLAGLVFPGFARAFEAARLAELPRYLRAMLLRVPRLTQDPRKDQARMIEVQEFESLVRELAEDESTAEAAERLRWLCEEYRVQLFAQELKTKEVVSEKRLRKLIGDARLT